MADKCDCSHDLHAFAVWLLSVAHRLHQHEARIVGAYLVRHLQVRLARLSRVGHRGVQGGRHRPGTEVLQQEEWSLHRSVAHRLRDARVVDPAGVGRGRGPCVVDAVAGESMGCTAPTSCHGNFVERERVVCESAHHRRHQRSGRAPAHPPARRRGRTHGSCPCCPATPWGLPAHGGQSSSPPRVAPGRIGSCSSEPDELRCVVSWRWAWQPPTFEHGDVCPSLSLRVGGPHSRPVAIVEDVVRPIPSVARVAARCRSCPRHHIHLQSEHHAFRVSETQRGRSRRHRHLTAHCSRRRPHASTPASWQLYLLWQTR